MDFQLLSRLELLLLFTISFIKFTDSLDTTQRPNVLFIVADDLRPTLGCYGEPLLRTPNIDNLASKSILFEQAFAQEALCAPSRTSFLTSRRPDTTRLYDSDSYWRTHAGNYTTLPQYFKENGYVTQCVSKVFHAGVASNKDEDAKYSWSYPPFKPPTYQYKNDQLCPNKDGTFGNNVVCPVDVLKMPGQSLPDIESADFTIEFLKNMSQTPPGKPFFLALGFHKPHIPLRYPVKYKGLYPITDIKMAEYHTYPWGLPLVAFNPGVGLRGRDDVKKLNISFPFGPFPASYQILMRQAYYAATSFMDAQLGRVLQALEANGFAENTIISFIGDHGWALGENQVWEKYSLFEVTNRVPFLLYIPKQTYAKKTDRDKLFPFYDVFQTVPSNGINTAVQYVNRTGQFQPRYKTSALTELVDLFPTLAEVAGLPSVPLCPVNPYNTLLCTEGASLMRLVQNITGNCTRNERSTLSESSTCSGEDPQTRSTAQDQVKLQAIQQCFPGFMPAVTPGLPWKTAAFSQYPRPSGYPQRNTECPLLADMRIMGYSIWTVDFHYTEWVGFNSTTYDVSWDEVYGRELYLRSSDPNEIDNVALRERCFPLITALSKQLRDGWRLALPQ